MTASAEDNRYTAAALEWAERTVGGRIVRKEMQPRWRPVWSLDIETPDGSVHELMLRGFRAPIGPDEHSFRERLRMEAGVLSALQETAVRVPRYFGHEPKGGWFLMERVRGTPWLTRVDNAAVQADLMRQYIRDIVKLHQLDPESLALPDNLPVARTHDDGATMMLREFRQPYAATAKREPEPLMALCDWWLDQHKPAPVDRFSLATGDIGPDQFLFEGSEYKAMFDLEMAHVGDPLQDLANMRLRTMCYPIPDLPDYISYWAQLMGRELDRESVCYWTVASMIASPMYVYPLWLEPDPLIIADVTMLHAFIPIYRRGAAEALAEYYGIELQPPERPAAVTNLADKYHTWLHGQLQQAHAPQSEGRQQFHLECAAALAATARLCNLIGPRLQADNLDDLAELLGSRPSDEVAGLRALEERVQRRPEEHLPQTIRVLHRIEARHEFLLEPVQEFAGFASGQPLERMN